MRPEVHVGAVGRVAAVELELVGKAGALFKGKRHTRPLELCVCGVGHRLHEGFVVVVPDCKLYGFSRRFRLRRFRCGRGALTAGFV